MNGVDNYTYVETENINQLSQTATVSPNIKNINYNTLLDSEITSTGILEPDIHTRENKFPEKLNLFVKRGMDIVGALVGIALLIPITIIIAIANIISGDKGPLFYSHTRIGKNGKHFKMYKFRSMCVDADIKLKELLEKDEEARKEWEENQKLTNDPRITKIGKFIRKTSLDEFPQFINVLKNEMSLVRTTCGS